jgi:hypothetical protein
MDSVQSTSDAIVAWMYTLSLTSLFIFPFVILLWTILEGRSAAEDANEADVERLGFPAASRRPLLAESIEETKAKAAGEPMEKTTQVLSWSSGRLGSRLPSLRFWAVVAALLCVAYVTFAALMASTGKGRTSWAMPIWTQGEVILAGHEASCNDIDRHFLSSLTGHAQSFFEVSSKCGKQSVKLGWTLWWSWETFESCFSEAYPDLSGTCVACYNAQGKYGFSHCKWQCLTSWCSKECLQCNDEFKKSFYPCVGMSEDTRPEAEQC